MPRQKIDDRFWSKACKDGDCLVWTAAVKRGYGTFTVRKGKSTSAHRFAYELTYGTIPKGLLVRHTCDNPLCVNPQHLILGTSLDNARDAVERGRCVRGSDAAQSKLSEQQVREIWTRLQNNEPQSSIAKLYNVSQPNIYAIARGKSWAWLSGAPSYPIVQRKVSIQKYTTMTDFPLSDITVRIH